MGHFFRESSRAVSPWVVLASWAGSQLRPWKERFNLTRTRHPHVFFWKQREILAERGGNSKGPDPNLPLFLSLPAPLKDQLPLHGLHPAVSPPLRPVCHSYWSL